MQKNDRFTRPFFACTESVYVISYKEEMLIVIDSSMKNINFIIAMFKFKIKIIFSFRYKYINTSAHKSVHSISIVSVNRIGR